MGLNPRQKRARANARRQQQEIAAYRRVGYSTGTSRNEPRQSAEGSPEPSSTDLASPEKKRPCPILNVTSPVTSRTPPIPPEGCLPYSFMVRRSSHQLFPKPVRRLNYPPEELAYPGDSEGHPDILQDREVREYHIKRFFEGMKKTPWEQCLKKKNCGEEDIPTTSN